MVVISRFASSGSIKCCQLIKNLTGIMLLEKSIQNQKEKCDTEIQVSGQNMQMEILKTFKSCNF